MKKSIFCLLLVLFAVKPLFSQDLSLKWSDKLIYDNKKEGFFNGFLGVNDKYLYTISKNLALKPSKANKKIKIMAFDKESMKQTASIAIRGYEENEADKEKYQGLVYHESIIFNDEVFIFWLKKTDTKSDKKEELFVESFDSELKRIKKLKKIYTANISDEVKKSRFGASSIVVLSNPKFSTDVIIGAEYPEKTGDVKFKYLVLNSELEVSQENELDLPIKLVKTKVSGLTSRYEFGKDGNLYIRTYVSLTKEERKAAAKGEDLSYCIFSIVNIGSGDITNFSLRDNGKCINDFSYVVTNNKVKIYGLFGDLEKDATGMSTHGIFYTEIDSKELEYDGLKYSYFDKKTIDDLFRGDEEDKKKTSAISKKKKKKAKENDAESMDVSFGIEQLLSVDEENVVLFCSKMYNYSVTTCTSSPNGGTSCTTRYYCQKSNVTAIKVNNEGEFVWGSNIDRIFTYSGTNVYDVEVIYSNGKFYTIYASGYIAEADKKNRKSRKKKSDFRDSFEYGVFDYQSGANSKSTFIVNTKNDVEKKSVSPTSIVVFDNKFYVNHEIHKQKLGMTIPVCAVSIVCPYLAIIPFVNGDFKKGYGNIGVISPIDGGGSTDKKKTQVKTKPSTKGK